MPKRVDCNVAGAGGIVMATGAGSHYLIETPGGVVYMVYADAFGDPAFKKSSDNGITWSDSVVLGAFTTTQISVWYDRWSGIDADLIHVVYVDSGNDDVMYRNINTASSDALGTQTTVFAGASTAAGGNLSITRARGGNLIVAYMIDAGAELGCAKSTDVGANWSAITSGQEATTDQILLAPGWAADNQDIMAFFWDASADEISRKLYDDSGNSWGETSIAGTMVDTTAANSFPHFALAVDIANSQNLLAAWSRVDTANADLRLWAITEGAITEKTNVVLNSVDDQGLCEISIDTVSGRWYVFYAGKSDGTETWPTAVNAYYKYSDDGGTTWSAEQKLTTRTFIIKFMSSVMRMYTQPILLMFLHDATAGVDDYYINTECSDPKASYQLGV